METKEDIKEPEHGAGKFTLEDNTKDMCPILYGTAPGLCLDDGMYERVPWECGEGWGEPLRKLSCALEALNVLFYDKHKVRIQAEQVKEKFGTLRFYCSVLVDNYTEEGRKAREEMAKYRKLLYSGYFKMQAVRTSEGYETTERNLSGKEIKVYHPPRMRMVPTEHEEEYAEMDKRFRELTALMATRGREEYTPAQLAVQAHLENESERLVREAETECFNRCEICGCAIGTDSSPRYITKGWIKVLCKRHFDELQRPSKTSGK